MPSLDRGAEGLAVLHHVRTAASTLQTHGHCGSPSTNEETGPGGRHCPQAPNLTWEERRLKSRSMGTKTKPCPLYPAPSPAGDRSEGAGGRALETTRRPLARGSPREAWRRTREDRGAPTRRGL